MTGIKTKSRVAARVTGVLTGTKPEPQKTIFRIAKVDEAVIRILRRALNKDDYRMRVRFRGKRRGSKNHTKKADATWFAIYIESKEAK